MKLKHLVTVLLIALVGVGVYHVRSHLKIAPLSRTVAADKNETVNVRQQPDPDSGAVGESPEVSGLPPRDQAQLGILREILTSKNDNDPRMDSELRNLSPEVKAEMRKQYLSLPMEDRNGRGLHVFLLGREIGSLEDIAFFNDVLSEAPCQSLANCKEPMAPGQDSHVMMGVGTTLLYPQLVALSALEKQVRQGPWGAQARTLLEKAAQAENPEIARRAREILNKS